MTTTAQTITVPTKYHKVKDHEARLITPVAIPIGSPIINPNPTIKDSAMAISGLFARENSAMKASSPKNNKGLMINPVTSAGIGRTKEPVTGFMIVRLTTSKINSRAITEIPNPGRKIARHFPTHRAPGVIGVANRHSIFPLIFSLVIGSVAKAQMKAIRIRRGRK